jgi:hypothetical protein
MIAAFAALKAIATEELASLAIAVSSVGRLDPLGRVGIGQAQGTHGRVDQAANAVVGADVAEIGRRGCDSRAGAGIDETLVRRNEDLLGGDGELQLAVLQRLNDGERAGIAAVSQFADGGASVRVAIGRQLGEGAFD